MSKRTMLITIAAAIVGLTGVIVSGGYGPVAASGQQSTWFDETMTHGPTREYAQTTHPTAPDNWTTPIDYANGRVYARVQVLTKPSTLLTAAQICVWRSSFTEETCSPTRTFTSPGVYWFDFGRPTSWWKLAG